MMDGQCKEEATELSAQRQVFQRNNIHIVEEDKLSSVPRNADCIRDLRRKMIPHCKDESVISGRHNRCKE